MKIYKTNNNEEFICDIIIFYFFLEFICDFFVKDNLENQ